MHPTDQLVNLPALDRFIDPSPLTVAPNTPVVDAIALLSQQQRECVLVMEGLQLVGLFTDRDALRLVASATNLCGVAIAEVMTRQIVSLKQSPDQNLCAALLLMHQHQIRHLPIVDEQDNLVGILTQTSLLPALISISIPPGNLDTKAATNIATLPPSAGAEVLNSNPGQCNTTRISDAIAVLQQEIVEGEQSQEALGQVYQEIERQNALCEQEIEIHKQAQASIKFQADILSQVNDAVIVIDNEHRISYWNQGAERLYNLKASEVMARRLEECHQYRWLKPEDEQAAYAALAATGSWRGENIHIKKNGEEIYVESSVSVLKDDSSAQIGLLAVIRNISDCRLAEEKIREQANLLDITSEAILVRGLHNQILFWNKGAERLYGWRAEEALGKDANDLLHQQSLPELEQAWKAVVEYGSWQGELCQLDKQGKEIIVASRWTMVCDEAGKPKSILTVDTDITEKKQLETQLVRIQRLESLGTLASGIAHDLNNILTPILAVAQLLPLKLPNLDERSQQMLKHLEISAKRGSDLVNQILSFACGSEVSRMVVEVKQLLLEIVQLAKRILPASIQIKTNIARDLWKVAGDTAQLHQVFMNLIINARDAMPNGGILTISASNLCIEENYARRNIEAKVGNYVMVSVTDTGDGIPPEIIDRIFDPFFTSKEIGKGTGLGLSSALGIVKSHGGFVKVFSQLGSGSKFEVYLPIHEDSASKAAQDLRLFAGHGELILVVDDEAAICQIIKTTLEIHNYRVLIANDGIEAIALYAQHKHEIRVVLMEMMIPLMDGSTAICTLRRINPQVQIVAISRLISAEAIAQTTGVGIQGFLAKPFTGKELLKTLQGIVRRERN